MDKRLVKVSKFLSLVLRHAPETINLTLDKNGWARVDELIAAANRAGVDLDEKLLNEVVGQNDKKRFAFSEDGSLIRASQGHSIEVELALEKIEPPETLYHGTASRFIESIKAEGLIKGNRQHVHLSKDEETAIKVGTRHGKPIVLKIESARMHNEGFDFFLSANGVWLTESVPVKYITFSQ
jgi:putative RNA 2'-phosphotransferase